MSKKLQILGPYGARAIENAVNEMYKKYNVSYVEPHESKEGYFWAHVIYEEKMEIVKHVYCTCCDFSAIKCKLYRLGDACPKCTKGELR